MDIILLLLIIGLAVWLATRLTRAERTVDELNLQLGRLDRELQLLRRQGDAKPPPIPSGERPNPHPDPLPSERERGAETIPSPPSFGGEGQGEGACVAPQMESPTPPPVTPPLPPVIPPVRVPVPPPPAPAFNWEQFMGVKLFAWIGGFVLFLALVFFLKYAFENQLISPVMQVAGEYLLALGLLAGGLWLRKRNASVLGSTLCATGIVALYAVTFAGHAYYRLLELGPTFGVMALITAAAFVLAVRLDAPVVAVLGLVGGFLTPVILSTGKDNPAGLFSYIAVLDIGLLLVALRKRWQYLSLLAAFGTFVHQLGWLGRSNLPADAPLAMGIFLGFAVLFALPVLIERRRQERGGSVRLAAVGMAFLPVLLAFHFVRYREIAVEQPLLFFGFLLAADVLFALIVLWDVALAPAQVAAGGAVFLVLLRWLTRFFDDSLLYWGLVVILVFGVLHALFPVLLRRVRPEAGPERSWQFFPLAALVLLFIPVTRLPELAGVMWSSVLVLDGLLFALAIVTGATFAMVGAVVLTVALAGLWIVRLPLHAPMLPEMLWVIGGFAVFFFALSALAFRRRERLGTGTQWSDQLPALGAVLPFFLLMLATGRLSATSTAPLFAVALGLVVLLLAAVRLTRNDWAAAVALGCAVFFVSGWRYQHFQRGMDATEPVIWHAVIVVTFLVFPFLFRRQFQQRTLPWAVAALAGPVFFRAIYRLVKMGWPDLQPYLGLVPAIMAVPVGLACLAVVRGRDECRLSQMAWFGGATLFFVTLIFPIQFSRQWLTVAWALEGAALLWLWQRVPHNGLRWVGGSLLVAAFCRLALNPAVFGYQVRAETPILNWYLYAYGVVTATLFAGAWLVGEKKARALLAALGTVLAFLLVNIQIADFFTEPGTRVLTFQFSGNLARDMTCSIAWALFALALLVVGIARPMRPARFAALALLSVTVVKLLFFDLANLSQLYRIGATVGVAVVLLVASFLYQKFVTAGKPQE